MCRDDVVDLCGCVILEVGHCACSIAFIVGDNVAVSHSAFTEDFVEICACSFVLAHTVAVFSHLVPFCHGDKLAIGIEGGCGCIVVHVVDAVAAVCFCIDFK